MFPLVYEVCATTSLNIDNLGYWKDLHWHWNLGVNEFALHGEVGEEWWVLVSTLTDVKPNVDEVDKVVCWRNGEGFQLKIAMRDYMN